MENIKIILSGFGGQGVLTLGQILAELAMEKNKEVTWMPSYGAEMRGGTANCSVIIGEEQIASPIIGNDLDILVAMNNPSLHKFIDKLKTDGTVIYNTSMVEAPIGEMNKLGLDATAIASKLGNLKTQNMVVLGLIMKVIKIFSLKDVEQILKTKFTGNKAKLIDINLEAVKIGLS